MLLPLAALLAAACPLRPARGLAATRRASRGRPQWPSVNASFSAGEQAGPAAAARASPGPPRPGPGRSSLARALGAARGLPVRPLLFSPTAHGTAAFFAAAFHRRGPNRCSSSTWGLGGPAAASRTWPLRGLRLVRGRRPGRLGEPPPPPPPGAPTRLPAYPAAEPRAAVAAGRAAALLLPGLQPGGSCQGERAAAEPQSPSSPRWFACFMTLGHRRVERGRPIWPCPSSPASLPNGMAAAPDHRSAAAAAAPAAVDPRAALRSERQVPAFAPKGGICS
uniref:Uncharacterized protein n=1 Tax=Ursus americanus TaxID=9643 RepID=A0A452QI43_URSAM